MMRWNCVDQQDIFMRQHYKLRFKIILHLCLLFGAVLMAQGYFASTFFYSSSLSQIKQEQINRIDALGAQVDQKFDLSHRALIAVAQQLPQSILADSSRLQLWLDDRRGIASIFDNGLFIFAADGTLLVESPFRENRRGKDYSFRSYYQQTVKRKQPFVSDPYFSSQNHHHPVVMMTAPVFDATGTIVAILGGSLDLLGDNFLGGMSHQKLGLGGNFYLVGQDGTIIVHPKTNHIMQQCNCLGAELILAKAASDSVGCTEMEDSDGQTMLTAFKLLKVKDWVLISNYPVSEIRAPLQRYYFYFWTSAVGTFVLLLALTVLLLRQVFSPLFRFTQHLATLSGKKGKERWFLYHGDGEIGMLVRNFNKVLLEVDLAHRELDYAQQMAHLGSWHWDIATDKLQWSDEVFRIFGDQPGAYEPTYALFLSRVHPEDRAEVSSVITDALRNKHHYEIEHRVLRLDGTVIYVREQGEAKYDATGEAVAMVGTVLDINNLMTLQNRLKELATVDELTGAVNRREFFNLAEKMAHMVRRNGAALSLLFFDFDHFKQVNDDYGHLAGDEVLQKGVALFGTMLRGSDTLARYGGEEFCALLPDCDIDGAKTMAERCRKAVEEHRFNLVDGRVLSITVSIGVATLQGDESFSGLLNRADQAVYLAKERGRNCVVALD